MYRTRSAIACIMFGAFGCVSVESEAPPASPTDTSPHAYKQVTAERAAAALSDPAVRAGVLDELRRTGPRALAQLPALAGLADDNRDPSAVPEVWLHDASGDGDGLIVAYAPAGDERSWAEVPGYLLDGTRIALDPLHPPAVPVLVIETHGRLAMHKGVEQANLALRRAGLQHEPPPAAARAVEGRWTSRLDAIRLSDDQEPWVSGDAEIYIVTSGVVGDNQPELRIVDLPYLDSDGTTYRPNQIILDWTAFEYQVANLQVYEHDDNTNYQQLVTALVTAIGELGSLAGYPVVQAIAEIANRVIAVMPAGWFSNDDDYVDSFYTIEKTASYVGRVGARGNATITLVPFFVAPN